MCEFNNYRAPERQQLSLLYFSAITVWKSGGKKKSSTLISQTVYIFLRTRGGGGWEGMVCAP